MNSEMDKSKRDKSKKDKSEIEQVRDEQVKERETNHDKVLKEGKQERWQAYLYTLGPTKEHNESQRPLHRSTNEEYTRNDNPP